MKDQWRLEVSLRHGAESVIGVVVHVPHRGKLHRTERAALELFISRAEQTIHNAKLRLRRTGK